MSDINFQPIFDYIDESSAKLKEDLRIDLTDVKTSIANLSAQVKKYHEEMLVSGHRIDRLEEWAKTVGEKVGLPISF
jgi:uncharacterized coiled-coil DUF342 family protein